MFGDEIGEDPAGMEDEVTRAGALGRLEGGFWSTKRPAFVVVDANFVVAEIDDVEPVAFGRPLRPVGVALRGGSGAAEDLRTALEGAGLGVEGENRGEILAIVGYGEAIAVGAQRDVARIFRFEG